MADAPQITIRQLGPWWEATIEGIPDYRSLGRDRDDVIENAEAAIEYHDKQKETA